MKLATLKKSVLLPPGFIPLTCLSLLSSCHNFSPALRTSLQSTAQNQKTAYPSLATFRILIGNSFNTAEKDFLKLKSNPNGQQLAKAYLHVISANPSSKVVESLSSILKSQSFINQTSNNKILILKVLEASMTEKRAKRFENVFLSPKLSSAFAIKDFSSNTLLDNLYSLASEPLHIKFEESRGAMLAALLEFAVGGRPLDQGDTNGCGPIACLLALENKSEIVRLVLGLSSPGGEVRMASGHILKRSESSLGVKGDNEQGIAIRILADAISNHGNGVLITHNSNLDLNFLGPIPFPGMLPVWARKTISDLSGKEHKILKKQAVSLAGIKEAIDRHGYAICLRKAALTDWHWIVVRKIESDWVYYQDPNGTCYSLPLSEVKELESNRGETKSNKPSKKTQSEINFPEEPYGPPLDAVYRVPLDSFSECLRAAILP